MIAIIDQYAEHGVKLIPFSVANLSLCEAAAEEVDLPFTDGTTTPNSDKLETLLEDSPVIEFGKIVECKAVFVHVSEW